MLFGEWKEDWIQGGAQRSGKERLQSDLMCERGKKKNPNKNEIIIILIILIIIIFFKKEIKTGHTEKFTKYRVKWENKCCFIT